MNILCSACPIFHLSALSQDRPTCVSQQPICLPVFLSVPSPSILVFCFVWRPCYLCLPTSPCHSACLSDVCLSAYFLYGCSMWELSQLGVPAFPSVCLSVTSLLLCLLSAWSSSLCCFCFFLCRSRPTCVFPASPSVCLLCLATCLAACPFPSICSVLGLSPPHAPASYLFPFLPIPPTPVSTYAAPSIWSSQRAPDRGQSGNYKSRQPLWQRRT